MNSEVIFDMKEKEIKKGKTKRLLFVSTVIVVLSIVILNLISFLIA